MPLKIDTSKKGLRMILKDYQELTMRYIWSLNGEGASSRDIWEYVKEGLKGKRTISRTAIIYFLNDMVEEGVLNCTGPDRKKWNSRIYSMKHDEAGFKEYIAEQAINKLLSCFPEETRKAIDESGWTLDEAG